MEVNKYTPEALARLPREELRRMLAEELNKDPTKADDALVRSLLAELQTRNADPVFTDDDAVLTACEKFQTATEATQQPQKRWYQSWLIKVASVLLVLGILFFSLPATAEAKKVPDILTWWSNSLFQFFRPNSRPNVEEYVFKTNHPGLQELHDAVTEAGITLPIIPSQLSNEFKLEELQILQLEEDTSVFTRLASDRNKILFTAITHSQQSMLQYEKKADSITIWNIADIDHYVLSNTDTFIITWIAENIECTITTDCPEEDIYKLIYSIYYISED